MLLAAPTQCCGRVAIVFCYSAAFIMHWTFQLTVRAAKTSGREGRAGDARVARGDARSVPRAPKPSRTSSRPTWKYGTVARCFVQASCAKGSSKESHAWGGFRESVPSRTPTSFQPLCPWPHPGRSHAGSLNRKLRLVLQHLGLSAGGHSGAVVRQDRAKLRIPVALAGTSLQEAQTSGAGSAGLVLDDQKLDSTLIRPFMI